MRTFLLSLAFIIATAACLASGSEEAPEASPIYPFWDRAGMPDGPAAATDRMPLPTASAVLVAPGYLVTSAEFIDAASLDVRDSDVVYVFDGQEWHSGRYVDYDSRTRLALIRADVPGIPMVLASKPFGPMRLTGIPWAKGVDRPIVLKQSLLRECDGPPDFLEGIMERRFRVKSRCFQGQVKTLAGGALVDGDGRLAGLQVNSTGAQYHSGVDAAEILYFMETYFASWGSDVKNKPTHLYQK